MEIFKAGDYKTREDLEKAIVDKYGLFIELKNDVSIEGTHNELRNLHLSENCMVYGIKIIEVDSKNEKNVKNDKPDRGIIYKSGINLKK